MLLYDHARQPPGGHIFVDPTSVVLRGKTIEELIKNIRLYRTNNGLPAGNPEAEIEIDYRTRFPWLVSKVGPKPVVPEPTALQRWIQRTWANPPKTLVFAEIAESRRMTCLACPYHDPVVDLTPAESRRLAVLAGGRYMNNSGYCTKHHFALGLALLLDHEPVPASSPPDPAVCWLQT